jgi:hypothetical protein
MYILAHEVEFRHLMPANKKLSEGDDMERVRAKLRADGSYSNLPAEVDADNWLKLFKKGDCSCGD